MKNETAGSEKKIIRELRQMGYLTRGGEVAKYLDADRKIEGVISAGDWGLNVFLCVVVEHVERLGFSRAKRRTAGEIVVQGVIRAGAPDFDQKVSEIIKTIQKRG